MKITCNRCGRSFGIYVQDQYTPFSCPFCGRKLGVAKPHKKKPCGCGA